jgi:membrane protease YdiL (CAAX protease family)
MFVKLTDTNKAAIFGVLVLCMSVGTALLIRFLGLSPGPGMWTLWSFTPTVATLIMLLVVTRDGYSKEGWKSLGLHRLGLSVWWIAFGGTLLITVAASAIVWATPLASFVVPEGGIIDPIIQFLIFVGLFTVWFGLGEEIGMRGYLQTRLMSLGRRRALLLVGLLWATWHMPLIFLAPAIDFPTGNLFLFFPLFYGTIVAASFFYGYLRIYTGSIWPASIAHAVHNAAWNILGSFTLITASPVLVNVYLVGDFGLLILIGVVIGAIWLGHYLRSGMDEAQSGAEAPEGVPATSAATAAPRELRKEPAQPNPDLARPSIHRVAWKVPAC